MSEGYFSIGTTLANMVNLETIVSGAPDHLPISGGSPMPLQGGVGRRALSGRLRRSGNASGAWLYDFFTNDYADLNALQYAIFGDLTTASVQRYVSTIDANGFYSPFLCTIDCPYIAQSATVVDGRVPRSVRFDLIGGVLQSLTKTANYTVTTADHLIYFDSSGGSRTATLFDVATAALNVVYSVVKTSASNNLVIDPSGAQLIDGASTKTVTALNARVDFVTKNGTSWITI